MQVFHFLFYSLCSQVTYNCRRAFDLAEVLHGLRGLVLGVQGHGILHVERVLVLNYLMYLFGALKWAKMTEFEGFGQFMHIIGKIFFKIFVPSLYGKGHKPRLSVCPTFFDLR